MGRVGNERKLRTTEELESEVFRYDAYETPPHVVRSLLIREPKIAFACSIFEPGCGCGSMTRELIDWWPERFEGDHVRGDLAEIRDDYSDRFSLELGKTRSRRFVHASDIRKGDHIAGERGIDFLDPTSYAPDTYHAACVNPPFKLTTQFIERLHEVVMPRGLFAVLQRVQLKEGLDRYRDIWSKRWLRRYYQFSSRVNFYPEGGTDHRIAGQFAFGWYVFEDGWDGPYEGHWINEAPRTMGQGALLPQQAGLCEWCRLESTAICTPAPAMKPIKKGSAKLRPHQLTAPMLAWLRENAPSTEPGGGPGRSLDCLCGNWEPSHQRRVMALSTETSTRPPQGKLFNA